MTITRKRLMSAMEKSKQTWSPHLKPYEPSEAERKAVIAAIKRVIPMFGHFAPEKQDEAATAALIAADKARRG